MDWSDALAGVAPWLGACLFLVGCIVAVRVVVRAASEAPEQRAQVAENRARIEALERASREANETAAKALKVASRRQTKKEREALAALDAGAASQPAASMPSDPYAAIFAAAEQALGNKGAPIQVTPIRREVASIEDE